MAGRKTTGARWAYRLKALAGMLDVKTDSDHASVLGVGVRTLRSWREGRSEPRGPALNLLELYEELRRDVDSSEDDEQCRPDDLAFIEHRGTILERMGLGRVVNALSMADFRLRPGHAAVRRAVERHHPDIVDGFTSQYLPEVLPGFPEGSGVRPGTPALLSSRFGGEANLLGGVIDRNLGLIFSPPAPGRYVVRYATGGGWRASEFAVEKREFHADGDSYKITEVRVGRQTTRGDTFDKLSTL